MNFIRGFQPQQARADTSYAQERPPCIVWLWDEAQQVRYAADIASHIPDDSYYVVEEIGEVARLHGPFRNRPAASLYAGEYKQSLVVSGEHVITHLIKKFELFAFVKA